MIGVPRPDTDFRYAYSSACAICDVRLGLVAYVDVEFACLTVISPNMSGDSEKVSMPHSGIIPTYGSGSRFMAAATAIAMTQNLSSWDPSE